MRRGSQSVVLPATRSSHGQYPPQPGGPRLAGRAGQGRLWCQSLEPVEPAGPDVIRVPGGTMVAKLVATVGFLTTSLTIALSLVPQPDEPNKPLAIFKVVGGCGALILLGVWIYLAGKRRAARAEAT